MIKAIYSGEFLEGAVAGEEVGLVLDSTSFYAEQGGQVLFCSHDQLFSCRDLIGDSFPIVACFILNDKIDQCACLYCSKYDF